MLKVIIDIWKLARLYIARYPLLFCEILWLVLLYNLLIKKVPNGEIVYFVFFYVISLIISSCWLIVIVMIRKKYITFINKSRKGEDKTLILLKVDSNGQVIEYGDLLWGEEGRNVHRIHSRQSLSLIRIMGIDAQGYFTISYNDNGLAISIPIGIYIRVKNSFDWQEVYDKIILDADTNALDDFIIKIFCEHNLPNKKVHSIVIDYVNRKINEPQLVLKLKEIFEFPAEALSNFREGKIKVSSPAYTATKRIPAELECLLDSVG